MNGIIGIRSETKDTTEKRAALTPDHVKKLIEQDNLKVFVQPSEYRIFSNQAYAEAGAQLSDNLEQCNIIYGVKEVPVDDLYHGKPHVFFSHTIKGQDYNMPLLKDILKKKVTLLDYETIVDDKGRRLIFFGNFAGYVGMINTLWAFGRRMEIEGIKSPFSNLKQANQYNGLDEAKEAIIEVGRQLRSKGLPADHPPVVIALMGEGNVTQGAIEITNLLPIQEVQSAELPEQNESGHYSPHHVQKVVFHLRHWLAHNIPDTPFVEQAYFDHPEDYHSIFEQFVGKLTIIANGNFWVPGLPKILTKAFIKKHFHTQKQPLLRVVGDISCDIEGSVEFNLQATKSDNPVYVYLPEKDEISFGFKGHGPVVLAVDKLPSEVPREASGAFGDALLPFVGATAICNFEQPYDQLDLPAPLKNAIIAHQGQLTPQYKYLEDFLK